MKQQFTLEYWQDDGWYVGKLKEIPGVFSQGETIEELEKNIQDAYRLMIEDESAIPDTEILTKEIGVEIWSGGILSESLLQKVVTWNAMAQSMMCMLIPAMAGKPRYPVTPK